MQLEFRSNNAVVHNFSYHFGQQISYKLTIKMTQRQASLPCHSYHSSFYSPFSNPSLPSSSGHQFSSYNQGIPICPYTPPSPQTFKLVSVPKVGNFENPNLIHRSVLYTKSQIKYPKYEIHQEQMRERVREPTSQQPDT